MASHTQTKRGYFPRTHNWLTIDQLRLLNKSPPKLVPKSSSHLFSSQFWKLRLDSTGTLCTIGDHMQVPAQLCFWGLSTGRWGQLGHRPLSFQLPSSWLVWVAAESQEREQSQAGPLRTRLGSGRASSCPTLLA